MNRHAAAWIGLLALVLAAASGSAVFIAFDRVASGAPYQPLDDAAPTLVVVVVPGQAQFDPLPTPTPTPIPALDVRRVSGTGGLPLLVRAAPGGAVIGALPEGDLVVVTGRPRPDATGAAWYRVTQHGEWAVTGWVSGRYLAAVELETVEMEGVP